MKAYVLEGIGKLDYKEVKAPVLKPGEVLIGVKAAGICGSDIPRVFETGTYSFPLIPGHEFAGTVIKTGEDVERSWLGKRVGIFPLIPCMNCECCRSMQFELCRQYSYLGSRTNGGFGEYVAVPEWNLIELPKNVSFVSAAMLEPMAVAVHAMRSAEPKEMDTVAIWGLGTIGLLLAMFLQEKGIKNILLIGNKDPQRVVIEEVGIPNMYFCDSKKQDAEQWILEQTSGLGVDVFFECVGRNETIESAFRCTAPGGKVQMVGNPLSDITFDKQTYWKLLRNQLTLKGSWNSSFTHNKKDDWHYVLEKLQEGKIAPERLVTHNLDFTNLKKGLDIMKDKSEDYVKVMVAAT